MRKIYISLLMGFFCMIFASPAFAGFEMSQSQEVTIENASSGKITQKQTQTMRMGLSYRDNGHYRPRYLAGPARKYHREISKPVSMTVTKRDNAWVNWDYRGGICKVYYSELGESYYNNSAETDCNNGGMTINNLDPNKTYQFYVQQH